MQSKEDSAKVVSRFFEAIYDLKRRRVIRGVATFANRYGINRRHLWTIEHGKNTGMLQMAWFTYLVNDYNVSARWLLTGEGNMYTIDPDQQWRHLLVKRRSDMKKKPDES